MECQRTSGRAPRSSSPAGPLFGAWRGWWWWGAGGVGLFSTCSERVPCEGSDGVVERGSGAAGAGVVLGALLGPETTGPSCSCCAVGGGRGCSVAARRRGGRGVGVWCFDCSRRPAGVLLCGFSSLLRGGVRRGGPTQWGVCGLLFENWIVDASILKTPHRAPLPVRGWVSWSLSGPGGAGRFRDL